MSLKPNRPIRVGTMMMMTDAKGAVPKASAAAPVNEDEPPALSSMTKAELLAAANADGVEVESDDNKADLVRKIEKARN